jgi:gluconolactonase
MTTSKGNFKVEPMTTTPMTMMGDCPFFDGETGNLYWTDTMGGQLFRMDTKTGHTHTARIQGETLISFMVPVDGTTNQFIVGGGKRLLLVTWDGTTTMAHITRILTELSMDGVRFNGAKTDTFGRLYLGTMMSEEKGHVFDMGKRCGSLYKYTMTEGLIELKTKVGLSNGMCFNDKTNTMYYIDSYDLNIKQFGFDLKAGTISGEKMMTDLSTFGTTKTNYPCGMTIDTEGHLYVAMCGGGRILKINCGTGKVMTEITMPVSHVTSMCFGGKNFETMYATTAGMEMMPTNTHQTHPAGLICKITGMGTRGMEMTKFMTN